MSEIRADKIHNVTGDNDSGIDLSTNDQILLKTADTTAVTINSSQKVTIGTGGLNAASIETDGLTKSDDTNTQINFLGSDVTQFKNGNSESARFIASTFLKLVILMELIEMPLVNLVNF